MEDERTLERRVEAALDLDTVEESPYLRRQRRVEVRRSSLSRSAAKRLKKAFLALAALGALALVGYRLTEYSLHGERFLLRPERLEVLGGRYVARAPIVEKFAGDVGRSVLAVPLAERRTMLEQVAWVESAEVVRLWPDRIRVLLRERTPVAFARTTAGLVLVDRQGVFLDRPPQAVFSFPVVTGVSENDPPEIRRQRMGLYNALIQDLDRDGSHYSVDLSEVDVSDPEDARIILADSGAGTLLVHLGNANFQERYRTYLAHIQEWRRNFPKIGSVDLRYERQIVVNPDRH